MAGGDAVKPYYQDAAVTIYHADCREILPELPNASLVTDHPYPNNAGLFTEAIALARAVVADSRWERALIFWNELEIPSAFAPLVAVHIWHRTNVNGRPYEPIFHYEIEGKKRRSDVLAHAAVFDGVGPGCLEYLGHPTQKPVALMRRLLVKVPGTVVDPFMGSGTTLRASKDLGRKAIGIEIEERYCEIAARRMAQSVLFDGDAE